MYTRLKRNIGVLAMVIIAALASNKVQAQADQDSESKRIVPDSVLMQYDSISKEVTTIYDTTFLLSKEEKKYVYELNYNYMVDTYFDRLRLDSLRMEVNKLNGLIHQKENQRAMAIQKKIVGEDKEKRKKFRDARRNERSVLSGLEINNRNRRRQNRRNQNNIRRPNAPGQQRGEKPSSK